MRWPVVFCLTLILSGGAMAGPGPTGERRLDRSKAFEYILPEGWKADTPAGFRHDLIFLPAGGGFHRNIVINDQPGKSTLEVLKGKYERDLARALKDFRLVRSELVELDGLGRAVRIIHTNSAPSVPVRQIDYIVEIAGKRYFIACTVPAADGDRYDGEFEGFVLSMRGPDARLQPVPGPVEALNECVQERFRTVDGVGVSRLTGFSHLFEFEPTTPKEKAAVEGLRRRGLAVGVFLGGRGLLEPPLGEAEWKKAGEFFTRRRIGEPIVVKGEARPADLPRPWELQAIGRTALDASRSGDLYQASVGGWSVDARPIRASRAECLRCHALPGADRRSKVGQAPEDRLKVGDALGVAIYVYRPKAR